MQVESGTDGLLIITLMVLYIGTSNETVSESVNEICLMEQFDASCPPNHVTVMVSAQYGRMHHGKCAPVGTGKLGCVADVTAYFDGMCSGKPSCSVMVPNQQLHDLNVCPTGYLPFLEATYQCVQVLAGTEYQRQCSENHEILIANQIEGFLSSSFSFSVASQASRLCPWVIKGLPGQRINLTLFDFAYGVYNQRRPLSDRERSTCRKYATISEDSIPGPTTVCSGAHRERHIYLSKSNKLEITFMKFNGAQNWSNFLIRYNVFGCPDPEYMGNTILERSNNRIVLHCDITGERIHLICRDMQWRGIVQPCEKVPDSEDSLWNVMEGDWSSSRGITIIVIIGLVLGTIIGLCLLVCVYMFMKKHQLDPQPKQGDIYYESTSAHEDGTFKWQIPPDNLDNKTYNTYDKTLARGGRIAHVWSPVARDIMIMEMEDYPTPIPTHEPTAETTIPLTSFQKQVSFTTDSDKNC